MATRNVRRGGVFGGGDLAWVEFMLYEFGMGYYSGGMGNNVDYTLDAGCSAEKSSENEEMSAKNALQVCVVPLTC